MCSQPLTKSSRQMGLNAQPPCSEQKSTVNIQRGAGAIAAFVRPRPEEHDSDWSARDVLQSGIPVFVGELRVGRNGRRPSGSSAWLRGKPPSGKLVLVLRF